MKKEYDLKEANWKSRTKALKSAKVSKTFRIDLDVFAWLQEESDRTGIPYQTLLNAKLREAMNLPDRVREIVREELKKKKAS